MTQNFVVTGTQGALKLGDPNMFNAEPVSYTHLDVYKRQVTYSGISDKP